MITPEEFKSWLDQNKIHADYQEQDFAAFDIAITNYELLFKAWQVIRNDQSSETTTTQNLYKSMLTQHQTFLDSYGLTGKSRFKKDVITRRLNIDTDKSKDQLELFMGDNG